MDTIEELNAQVWRWHFVAGTVLFITALTVSGSEARAEALREAVKANPEAEVPRELEYLVGGKPEPWRMAKIFFGRWWQAAAVVLAALLAAGYLLLRWFGGTYLDIRDFDKGTTDKTLGRGCTPG